MPAHVSLSTLTAGCPGQMQQSPDPQQGGFFGPMLHAGEQYGFVLTQKQICCTRLFDKTQAMPSSSSSEVMKC